MNIAVLMTLFITDSQTLKSQNIDEKWTAPPSTETLANHEEIQKYGSDSKRNFKKLVNPLNDSYINAYNFHHDNTKISLTKRHAKDINSPQIFKFLSEEAKEPDEATKELIRVHRARQLQLSDGNGRSSDLSKRPKRSVKITKPQLIRFEYTDAKEPDDATKELIRKSRAKEISMQNRQVVSATTHGFPIARKPATRKRKRRSPQKTPPNFIRFQLDDAIEMHDGIRAMLEQTANSDSEDNLKLNRSRDLDEPAVQESKHFAYLTTPFKQSRLPHTAQKSIGRIIKARDAQIYYKYMHPNTDARHLIPIYEPGSPALPASHVADNFGPMYSEQTFISDTASVHPIAMNVLPSPLHQQSSRPIQLSEVSINQQYYPITPQSNAAVYHHPTTYLKAIADFPQTYNQVATLPHAQKGYQLVSPLRPIDGNELSNRYPLAKFISLEEPSHRYGKPLHFTESGGTEQQQTLSNKDTAKLEQNLNKIPLEDVREFRELSSLIGRSPTDQIHGLAYLLAKQMQRAKNIKAKRPHDNTSPILFHPENNRESVKTSTEFEDSNIYNRQPNNGLEVAQAEHYPLGKTGSHTRYDPQVNSEASVFISKPPAPPQPTSFSVVKMLGLSSNYKENDRIVNQRALSNFESESEVEKDAALENASKYAFGYRVRDFQSANDFGHKQNRDLDGVTRGQYHILLPDGRVQNVIYHADDTGFHADVSFKTGDN